MKRLVSLLSAQAMLSICLSLPLLAQVSSEPIYGPYNEYGGTYFVRVKIHFVDGDVPWTPSADLNTRANTILATLNNVYYPLGIYFLAVDGNCPDASTIDVCSANTPYVVESWTSSNIPVELQCDFAIDIFDQGDDGNFNSEAVDAPGTAIRIKGSENGFPASYSPNMIHEMGHALSLLHTSNFMTALGLVFQRMVAREKYVNSQGILRIAIAVKTMFVILR